MIFQIFRKKKALKISEKFEEIGKFSLENEFDLPKKERNFAFRELNKRQKQAAKEKAKAEVVQPSQRQFYLSRLFNLNQKNKQTKRFWTQNINVKHDQDFTNFSTRFKDQIIDYFETLNKAKYLKFRDPKGEEYLKLYLNMPRESRFFSFPFTSQNGSFFSSLQNNQQLNYFNNPFLSRLSSFKKKKIEIYKKYFFQEILILSVKPFFLGIIISALCFNKNFIII